MRLECGHIYQVPHTGANTERQVFILDGGVETPGKERRCRQIVDSGLCLGSQQKKWSVNEEVRSEE